MVFTCSELIGVYKIFKMYIHVHAIQFILFVKIK